MTAASELAAQADLYEAALAANDLAALDGFFRDHEDTIRYGVGENLYGPAEIAAFRRARTGGSPPRVVLRRAIQALGPDVGVVSLEFRRDGSAQIGRQMQTWVRTPDGWKIAAAHVSIMAERPETEAAGTAAVRARAEAIGLALSPAQMPGVARNIALLGDYAHLLGAVALPDTCEPAGEYAP